MTTEKYKEMEIEAIGAAIIAVQEVVFDIDKTMIKQFDILKQITEILMEHSDVLDDIARHMPRGLK